jgi:hypothetical protein
MSKRVSYANVVASLALFVALGGGAYAATSAFVSSTGAVTACVSKHGGAVAIVKAGRHCPKATTLLSLSERGQPGAAGPAGAPGANGVDGQPGQNATSTVTTITDAVPPGSTLPTGVTLKGVVGPFSSCNTVQCASGAGQGVSFDGYTLPAAPIANIVPAAGPATAACPGSSTNPTATAGNLCLYISSFQANETAGSGTNVTVVLHDPQTQTTSLFSTSARGWRRRWAPALFRRLASRS